MKRLLHWVVGAPVALAAILLSVANRGTVTFSLDPFTIGEPALAIDLPLFILLFGAMFLGLLVGWLVGWAGTARRRRETRRERREEAAPATTTAATHVPGGARALMPRQ